MPGTLQDEAKRGFHSGEYDNSSMDGISVDLSLFPIDPSSCRKIPCRSLKSEFVSAGSKSPSAKPQPPVQDLKNAIA